MCPLRLISGSVPPLRFLRRFYRERPPIRAKFLRHGAPLSYNLVLQPHSATSAPVATPLARLRSQCLTKRFQSKKTNFRARPYPEIYKLTLEHKRWFERGNTIHVCTHVMTTYERSTLTSSKDLSTPKCRFFPDGRPKLVPSKAHIEIKVEIHALAGWRVVRAFLSATLSTCLFEFAPSLGFHVPLAARIPTEATYLSIRSRWNSRS